MAVGRRWSNIHCRLGVRVYVCMILLFLKGFFMYIHWYYCVLHSISLMYFLKNLYMLFYHPESIWNFMYIYVIYHVVLHADFMYFYSLCQKWRIKHVQSILFPLCVVLMSLAIILLWMNKTLLIERIGMSNSQFRREWSWVNQYFPYTLVAKMQTLSIRLW